jgi:hypothetical protein
VKIMRCTPALLALAVALGPFAAPAAAEETAPERPVDRSDFTFKRVAVPSPGATGPRITVQIDPEEQAMLLALAPRAPQPAAPLPGAESGGSAAPSDYDWFWQAVSPAIDAGAGRFLAALDALANPVNGQRVPAPRMQHLQDIAARHGPDILRATLGTGCRRRWCWR